MKMSRLLTEAELAAKSARNRKAKAETWASKTGIPIHVDKTPVRVSAIEQIDGTQVVDIFVPTKPSKYKNTKTEVDGILFDSKKEAARWLELKALEAAGKIGFLERQVRVALKVNGTVVAHWVADFEYVEEGKKDWTWEDVKSDYTRKLPVYRLKKKLVKAIYGVDILES